MRYQILSDKNPEKLMKQVNQWLDHVDEWKLEGGLMSAQKGGETCFYQGISRKETTPLMECAQSELTADHAKILIENGADVNAKDNQANTPLMFASAFSTKELIQALLAKKADVKAVNIEGYTPLNWAVAHDGNIEIIKLLIKSGADVNAKNKLGYSILTAALINIKNAGVIKLLLDNKANVNDTYKNEKIKNKTPLMFAIEAEQPIETIKRILEAGADVNACDSRGRSALMYASKIDDEKVIDLLKEYGADTDCLNEMD